MSKPGKITVNHFQNSFGTVAGTEAQTTMFTGVDDVTNRSIDIPEGAVLTSVKIDATITSDPQALGKHQQFLMFRPGGVSIATPIAAWFTGTDPLPQTAIDVRRYKMSKLKQNVVITGISMPTRFVHFWKGKKPIRDGDDVVLCTLDVAITAWEYMATARYIM